jgi:hypothetical protein
MPNDLIILTHIRRSLSLIEIPLRNSPRGISVLFTLSTTTPLRFNSNSTYFSTMVFSVPIIATALLSGFAAAMPTMSTPDSAVGNEVAVSAPNGIPMSDTAMPV